MDPRLSHGLVAALAVAATVAFYEVRAAIQDVWGAVAADVEVMTAEAPDDAPRRARSRGGEVGDADGRRLQAEAKVRDRLVVEGARRPKDASPSDDDTQKARADGPADLELSGEALSARREARKRWRERLAPEQREAIREARKARRATQVPAERAAIAKRRKARRAAVEAAAEPDAPTE